jgi:hypothetical protein
MGRRTERVNLTSIEEALYFLEKEHTEASYTAIGDISPIHHWGFHTLDTSNEIERIYEIEEE